MIKIWDLWVRLFHWSLVIAVSFLLISGETGAGFFDWHRFAGEIVLALIVFRIIWGIVGSSNARLLSLVVNPVKAITHLRDLFRRAPHQERGHNAAGGWAVLTMLTLISVQAITGMFIADEDELLEGAMYGKLSSDTTDFLYNVHHFNAGLLQAILIVHVLMIALYYFLAKQNLVKPMINGKMHWSSNTTAPDVKFGGILSGMIIAILAFTAVGFLVSWF